MLQNNKKRQLDGFFFFFLAQEVTIYRVTHLLLSHKVSCEDKNSKNLSQHSYYSAKIVYMCEN